MSDILPVSMQNFLYCRKSELREQIKQVQSNQLSSGVKSAAYSYDKKFLGKDIIPKSNSCELYFEEQDIEAFVEKLERSYPSIQYVNKLMTHSWGQKVIRFYDLDGNLIEVGTPM